jgi:hypothetical protein
MPRVAPKPKAIKSSYRGYPMKLRKQPYTRSEVFSMDMYVSSMTGENTKKNMELLRLIHAQYLNENHPRDVAEDAEEDEKIIDQDDLSLSYHICDSYENRGIYCVYDDVVDHVNDHCCYCGAPDERK